LNRFAWAVTQVGFDSSAFGVGHSLPIVVGRFSVAPVAVIAEPPRLGLGNGEQESWHIFEPNEFGSNFISHADDLSEQIALVRFTISFASDGEGLTGEACDNSANIASKPCSGERAHIGPDGGVAERSVFDAGADDFVRRLVLFDVADDTGADSELGESGDDGAVKLA
jgi:hypothetical protein